MPKQDQDTSKQNHSPIQRREVLLPDEHPPIALKMSEEPPYLPASTVSPELPAILRSWLHPVPLMRSNQLNVQSGQLSIQGITIVSLVSNQPDGEISGKPRCESLSYKLDFMRASRTRVNGDRNTIAVDHCHDLATLAPLGLSHVPAPLLAVTNVPSMKHSVRSSLPRSRRSSANTFGVLSKTPSPAQFRYRRWQVWYGGYLAGRSCQGAPVLRIQRTPLRTSRQSLQGLPR